MSLLERVQRKAAGEEGDRPAIGRLAAGEAPAPLPARVAPEAAAPAAGGAGPAQPPPLAPERRPGQGGNNPPGQRSGGVAPRPSPQQAQFAKVKSRVHARLVEEMQDQDGAQREDIVAKIQELVNEVLVESNMPLPRPERNRLVETLVNDVLGLGPLEQLLNDPDISEIMINGPRQIYVEQHGKLTLSPITFETNGQLLQVIDRVVSSIGRRVDESSPMVDARLKDGSRVNVIIPPLALNGPTMTIRKFSAEKLDIDDLIRFNSLTREMAQFLRACVRSRLNVLVSGGTGSGKTTTLNVISSFIPEDERIVTVEDAAELQLSQEHVVTLESRPANVEGRGRVSIRDLVINCLRMRPDRIVIGECRGGEALDMLQAMNTGHDGSLTTVHANNPLDTMSRLETLVLMSGAELPSRAIREQIASAIHIVVQQSRMRDGTRKIVNVTEVVGLDPNDRIKIQDIFQYRQLGVDADGRVKGYFTATGIIPQCMEHLVESGEELPISLFEPTSGPGA
ncbi:MAG TPA: CpaF family protein [Candidatus Dormibacteraeota bacterium]|jgi:pilus assembly protein CpaF|nr:CpaF family protein [Candidatus Dormibacteraeota bacterium]